MPAGSKLVGFEGKLYWAAAGGTASTELLIARDVSYKFENVEADVSDRSSIINLYDVAGINFSLEFEVNNKQGHAFIVAMRAAIILGNAMAFRTRDYASGYGVDGDFIFSNDESQPLRDAQRLKLSCKPTDKNGRIPVWS
jgi:hypothetical protein